MIHVKLNRTLFCEKHLSVVHTAVWHTGMWKNLTMPGLDCTASLDKKTGDGTALCQGSSSIILMQYGQDWLRKLCMNGQTKQMERC